MKNIEESLVESTCFLKNQTKETRRVVITVPAQIPMRAIDKVTGEVREWVVDHRDIEIAFAPGQVRELPEKFMSAIHQCVSCKDPECRGARCKNPQQHAGAMCIAGLDPLLVRVDAKGDVIQTYAVHPTLIPRPVQIVDVEGVRPSDIAEAIERRPPPPVDDDQDPAIARARARRST